MLLIHHKLSRLCDQCLERCSCANRPLAIGALLIVLLTIGAGCSSSSGPDGNSDTVNADGSNSDGGTDSDGDVSIPSQQPDQFNGPVIVTRGVVANSQPLTVSGRTFNSDAADVSISGQSATLDDLVPGMQITIRSDDRNASSVVYEVDVSGPVDDVSEDGSITIMGQVVLPDADTRINHVFLSDFNVGDVYDVSGLRNDEQGIVASYIERQVNAASYEVTGVVKNLDVQAGNFSIQDLTINYAGADLSDLPTSGIAEGMYLQVKDTQANYEPGSLFLSATALHLASIDSLSQGNEIEYEIDGLVTDIESDDRFSLGSSAVAISDNTRFRGGSRADLISGSRMEVEGDFDVNNVLEAWEIEFPDDGGTGSYIDFDLGDADISEPEVDTDPTDVGGVDPVNDDGPDGEMDPDTEIDIPSPDSNSGGCRDSFDENGTLTEDLDSRSILLNDTGLIERSLCGSFDADFVEFSARANISYRIEVLLHQSPQEFGVYLQLLAQSADGSFETVNRTSAGNTLMGFTNGSTEKTHVVRIGSTESDEDRYGGGDYVLSITSN